jgi:hypothetical protein
MDLYEERKHQRDRFEILAVHDHSAQSFEEIEQHLESFIPGFKKNIWEGRNLPFPVLLDRTGKTLKTWQVQAFPTLVLLDPQGRIVERGDPCIDYLEQRLEESE